MFAENWLPTIINFVVQNVLQVLLSFADRFFANFDTSFLNNQYFSFARDTIKYFFPVEDITLCLILVVGLYGFNTVHNVILRIKGWIIGLSEG